MKEMHSTEELLRRTYRVVSNFQGTDSVPITVSDREPSPRRSTHKLPPSHSPERSGFFSWVFSYSPNSDRLDSKINRALSCVAGLISRFRDR
jgi:hypothetical protein